MKIHRWLVFFLILSTALTQAEITNAPTQVHNTRGLIREIAADRTTAVIRHEKIPGHMPAMTMELNVRDTNELSGMVVGDTVTFRLLANDETHWIDQIRKVAAATNAVPASPLPAHEQEFQCRAPHVAGRHQCPGQLEPVVHLL